MTPGTLVATASSDLVESAASHWATRRVGDLVKLINGFPFDSNRFGPDGTPLLRVRDLDSDVTETQYEGPILSPFLIENADLLVGMDGDFNVGRWRGSKPALLNQRVLALRGSSKVVRWLEYALPEPLKQINDLTYSTTVKHLSSAQVRAIRIRVPENLTDHLDYLDRETAEIDAFIADQEKLIELLTERRTATIEARVTKGLRPNVERVHSHVDWIGLVPEHWQVRKLSQLFAVIGSGTTPPRVDPDPYGGDIAWVTTSELREVEILATRQTVTDDALNRFSALQVYAPGTVLMAMYGATIGRLGTLGIFATTNQACCAFANPRGVSSRYIYYTLWAARRHLLTIADGGGQPNLNQEKLRQLRVPVPPLAEQSEIAESLDRETAEIDATLTDAREAIALSRERRAALISAAVTGKVDVREHRKVNA